MAGPVRWQEEMETLRGRGETVFVEVGPGAVLAGLVRRIVPEAETMPARDGETIAAYLFGFWAQTGPVAYAHLVAVRPEYRRRGLARRLYEHFIALARQRGCTQLKATAAPTNKTSIEFHTSLGMKMTGRPNADGVPVVKDYRRPGEDRVVFRMEIG